MARKRTAPKRGASRYQAPAKRSSAPGWVWLVAGLALGGFIMFLMTLEPGKDQVQRDRAQVTPGKTDKPVNTQPPTDVKSKYDFYNLLPDSKVVVPPEAQPPQQNPTVVNTQEEADKIEAQRALTALNGGTPQPPAVVRDTPAGTEAKASQPGTLPLNTPAQGKPTQAKVEPLLTNTNTNTTQYYLQAGSFRKQSDADQLRAQIIMLGHSARVESGKVREDTWYRVVVGPFNDRNKASSAQQQLAVNGLGTPLLQQRRSR